MSTRPCPHCGASNPEHARFCGQCGSTFTPSAAPAQPSASLEQAPPERAEQAEQAAPEQAAPDVHDEVTVARELPDISHYLSGSAPSLNETIVAPHRAVDPLPPKASASTQAFPGLFEDDPPPPAATDAVARSLGDDVTQLVAPDAPAPTNVADVAGTPAGAPPRGSLAQTMMMMSGQGAPTPPLGGTAARPDAPPPQASPSSVVSDGDTDADAVASFAATDASPVVLDGSAFGASTDPAPPPRPEPPLQRPPPAHRTMLGMPADLLAAAPRETPSPSNDAYPPPPAPVGAPAPYNVQKTMLGVAIPGIAPLHPSVGAPRPTHSGQPPGVPLPLPSNHSTMLGVAVPGIAPGAPRGGGFGGAYGAPAPYVPSQVQNTGLVEALAIVPRPKTLMQEALPEPPQLQEKRGISAVAVVGILIAVVAVAGGVGAFYALRSGASLTASPQLDESGRESLKLGCVSCPDGTSVTLGASTTTFTAGAAVLPLPAPLSIGDNNLVVKVDRPGAGRDEDVKIHVPVAYRIRADLSTLTARAPVITIRVEATPGSEVKVEDKPVLIDDAGRGSYAIDLSKETEGPGEAKTFERKIPFTITPKGGKIESGQLTARTGIVALALDAPGRELFTDKATAAVAGQTRPNGTLTIDGTSVPVDAQGRFGVRVELASVGEKPLELVASAPSAAPRSIKVRVVRVASLEAAAKEQEALSPIAYDAFGADPGSKVGQRAVVEGDVFEVRASGGHTVALVDNKRGCPKGTSCLVRVSHGEEVKVARGDTLRAYGRVLGAVTSGGRTVPDVDAALVLTGKAAK